MTKKINAPSFAEAVPLDARLQKGNKIKQIFGIKSFKISENPRNKKSKKNLNFEKFRKPEASTKILLDNAKSFNDMWIACCLEQDLKISSMLSSKTNKNGEEIYEAVFFIQNLKKNSLGTITTEFIAENPSNYIVGIMDVVRYISPSMYNYFLDHVQLVNEEKQEAEKNKNFQKNDFVEPNEPEQLNRTTNEVLAAQRRDFISNSSINENQEPEDRTFISENVRKQTSEPLKIRTENFTIVKKEHRLTIKLSKLLNCTIEEIKIPRKFKKLKSLVNKKLSSKDQVKISMEKYGFENTEFLQYVKRMVRILLNTDLEIKQIPYGTNTVKYKCDVKKENLEFEMCFRVMDIPKKNKEAENTKLQNALLYVFLEELMGKELYKPIKERFLIKNKP